jgi:signal transduction histidine kinase
VDPANAPVKSIGGYASRKNATKAFEVKSGGNLACRAQSASKKGRLIRMREQLRTAKPAISTARLIGSGEMAERVRAFDWESTAIGPVFGWTETLLSAVNMMLSASHPILLLCGPELILIYNDAFRPILTDRHPDALGARGREFWTDVWPVVGQQLESVLYDAQTVSFQNALVPILRNGKLEEAYFSYNYSPLFESDGRVAGIITICQDVTAAIIADRERGAALEALRVRQEELDRSLRALHAERARLFSVVQQAPAFFALLEGPTHVISMVNPLYMKLIGGRDVLGKPVAISLPEAAEQGYVALLDQVFTTGEPVSRQGSRFDLIWAEGQAPDERYLDFVYQPLREEDGSVSGIIALGVDVTENKRAQKALIQNEKLAAVGRLSASIAHEINNPLGAVTNLLYLAGLTGSLSEVQDYLHRADSELRRISAITNQTLSFSKQSSSMKTVNGAELLGGVIDIFQSRLLNGRVRVEQRVRSHDPIRCSEGEIRQVLSNLISNAIESMQSSGGRLLLRCRCATNWSNGRRGLSITVADTGTGIHPDVRKKIFEPFFTTKGQSGTGLGLSVSLDIVTRHEGSLRVRSTQVPNHSGTVFTLFLPFDAAI